MRNEAESQQTTEGNQNLCEVKVIGSMILDQWDFTVDGTEKNVLLDGWGQDFTQNRQHLLLAALSHCIWLGHRVYSHLHIKALRIMTEFPCDMTAV